MLSTFAPLAGDRPSVVAHDIFHPGRPTTPIDAGMVFLQDAARALHMLDNPPRRATGR
jgi:hypothetical protein